jgi:hypothetical protein
MHSYWRPGTVALMHNNPDCDRAPMESSDPAPADHVLFRTGSGKAAMAAALIAALGLLLPCSVTIPARAVDLDELTVVTVARDGSWGVATAGSQGPAIGAAIRDCQAMVGGPSDCGAHFITSRGGWVIATLCGDNKIIVGAETRQGAEQAALVREQSLGGLHACRRLLTVSPQGVVLQTQPAPAYQIDSRR